MPLSAGLSSRLHMSHALYCEATIGSLQEAFAHALWPMQPALNIIETGR
jgi:hypothetical protein